MSIHILKFHLLWSLSVNTIFASRASSSDPFLVVDSVGIPKMDKEMD